MGFQVFLPPQAWLLLLAFALFGTAVPYLLTNVGIKNIDASAAAIILLLDPICAVIFGIIFLGQPLLLWQAIGAILILIASVLIALESRFSVAKVI